MTKRYYKFGETHRTIKGRKQKYCTTCKQWKGESEFRKDRAKRDGLKIGCRDCDSAYQREYQRKHRGNARKYLKFEERHRIIDRVREKLCTKCGKWKKESEYYKQRSDRDGLAGQCRKCSYTPTAKSHK